LTKSSFLTIKFIPTVYKNQKIMLYYGMEKHYLNDIPVRLSKEENKVKVIYEIGNYSGYCEYSLYETKGKTKPLKQKNWLLINSDMGDILEYVHKKTPLSSSDFNGVNMTIREHSLSVLQAHLLPSN